MIATDLRLSKEQFTRLCEILMVQTITSHDIPKSPRVWFATIMEVFIVFSISYIIFIFNFFSTLNLTPKVFYSILVHFLLPQSLNIFTIIITVMWLIQFTLFIIKFWLILNVVNILKTLHPLFHPMV